MALLISLFLFVAHAQPKKTETTIVTNFLTEEDLNAWFVKIIGVIFIPVAIQLFSLWRESRTDISKDVKDMKIQIHEMKLMVAEMRGESRTIARHEAERVVELYERARR